MDISSLYHLYQSHRKVCTDSRKVEEGCIFFALKGPNFNGNKFAAKALESGASYAIIDEEEFVESEKTILVDDVLGALQSLASYHRKLLTIPVIGITGSNGKTTTKELLADVLACKYETFATQGNLNNHIGVPLSILSIDESQHEIAIIEMGSNAPGEIEFLSNLAKPTHGLITSIGKAHLEGFKDINGVLEEKTSLYRVVKELRGKLFVNAESHMLKSKIPEDIEVINYGSVSVGDNTVSLEQSFPYIIGSIKSEGVTQEINSSLFGEYNVLNICAALTIGKYFGVGYEDGVTAINAYRSTINRSERRVYKGAEIFLDAYNANPSSMQLVIENFRNQDGDKVLVLGDMLELGVDELDEHRKILDMVAESNWSRVFIFGELFSAVKADYEKFEFFIDFEKLEHQFSTIDFESSSILMKGSRGMALERLLKG